MATIASGRAVDDAAVPAMTKGQRTRARLLEAARRVFEEHGYLDTRIVDVAAAADVAVGSFYTYFDSKEHLFGDVIHEINRGMFPDVAEGLHGLDPIASIGATNRHFIEFYRQNHKMVGIMESVATFHPEFRKIRLETRKRSVERNERAIARLQAEGVVSPDLDPYVTANALVAMVSNFAYAWFVLGEEFDVDVATHHLTLLWARALGLDDHYPLPDAPKVKRRRGSGAGATGRRQRPARRTAEAPPRTPSMPSRRSGSQRRT